jgi:methyl-accepting chemotaxis protein
MTTFPLRAGRAGTVSMAVLALAVVALGLACAVWAGPPPALRAWIGGVGLGAAALAAAVAVRGARRMACELHRVQAIAQRLAQGDLGEPLASHGSPVQALLAEVGERMFRVAVDVRVGTTAIASTAGFVASDNTALSQRTESQASALQQTAASMEQLASTVRQNADHARQAHGLVDSAADSARRGGQVVGEVVQTMGSIRESSRRIVDITGVIDSIAFQTNILALNAAVEAARAGEQGRGFAVVAGEVRALAQRSATAAREIKRLIDESAARVEAGHRLAEQAGGAMNGMVEGVQRVARIMGEIVQASQEQSTGLEEIHRAIAQIDDTTQRNGALVEAAALTAGSLQAQAQRLASAVGDWHLGAREFGNAEQARALAEAGAEFVRQHGVERGKQAINDPQGAFVDRDLYLGMCGADGTIVANGGNPRLIGMDGNLVKDVQGRYFVKDIMRVGEGAGTGWVDYQWVHPLTRETMTKSAYVQAVGVQGMVISCGFYKR